LLSPATDGERWFCDKETWVTKSRRRKGGYTYYVMNAAEEEKR
jgi:hypothetical protein